MSPSPSWFHQLRHPHRERPIPSKVAPLSLSASPTEQLQPSPAASHQLNRGGLIRRLFSPSSSKYQSTANHAPVSRQQGGAVLEGSKDDTLVPYTRPATSGSASQHHLNSDVASSTSGQSPTGRHRSSRPQTSDGIRRTPKGHQVAAPLQRWTGKPAKLQWQVGPNGPEIITEQAEQVSPSRATRAREVDQRATSSVEGPRADASSKHGDTSIDSRSPGSSRVDKEDAQVSAVPTVEAVSGDMVGLDQQPTEGTKHAQSGQQKLYKEPLDADPSAAGPRSNLDEVTGAALQPPQVETAYGHWTVDMGSAVGPVARTREVAESLDPQQRQPPDNFMTSFDGEGEPPLIAIKEHDRSVGPVVDEELASAAKEVQTEGFCSQPSNPSEGDHPAPVQPAGQQVAVSADPDHSHHQDDRLGPCSVATPVETKGLGVEPPQPLQDSGTAEAEVASEDASSADPAADTNRDLLSVPSPPSRPSSISSNATPKRISFAPSVRSRNRPAPKGLAPPGLNQSFAGSRSTSSSESGSEADSASHSWIASGRKRKVRKRPVTAPAALEVGEGSGGGGGGTNSQPGGSIFRREAASQSADSDDDSDSDAGFRMLRWGRRRASSAVSADEDAEAALPSHRRTTETGGGSTAVVPDGAMHANEATSAAESSDAEHRSSHPLASTCTNETSDAPARELLFYPGTLILVRDGVEVGEASGEEPQASQQGESPASSEATRNAGAATTEGDARESGKEERTGTILLRGFKRLSMGKDRQVTTTTSATTSIDGPEEVVQATEATSAAQVKGQDAREGVAPAAAACFAPREVDRDDSVKANSPTYPPLLAPVHHDDGAGRDQHRVSPVDQLPRVEGCVETDEGRTTSMEPSDRVLDSLSPTTNPSNSTTVCATTPPPPPSPPTLKPSTAGVVPSTTVPPPYAYDDDEHGQILWHGSPPIRHVKMHTRALRLFKRVARPRSATSYDATAVSPSSSSSSSSLNKKKKMDVGQHQQQGPMLRIVSKEGNQPSARASGILLPDDIQRSYYYPGRTTMDLDWQQRRSRAS